MTTTDLRLIEDYLPIEAISAEASREKSVRKGHISTLHLWWARRPLVACRAAVYGALVPADQYFNGDLPVHNVPANPENPQAIENWKNGTKKAIIRAAASKCVSALCKYPGDPRVIQKAQEHILKAHAERLTAELKEAKAAGGASGGPAWVEEFKFKGDKVSYEDIVAGRAPRPRVLDMFAGGGAIPLEALRLGCEAYALDLNPVAHIIELCTLVYPQKYGKPDANARGMTGPTNAKGEATWGGLANEVRYWGNWVLDRVRKEIGDLYPPIPDPAFKGTHPEITFDRNTGRWVVVKAGKLIDTDRTDKGKGASGSQQKMGRKDEDDEQEDSAGAELPAGFLQPLVYLWTRTVRCKKPGCSATVPLSKLQWIRREPQDAPGHYVGVVRELNTKTKTVSFQPVSGDVRDKVHPTEHAARAGNVVCPFCHTVNDDSYVKQEGCAGRIGFQLMIVGTKNAGRLRRVYVGDSRLPPELFTVDAKVRAARERLCSKGLSAPDEKVVRDGKQSVWIDLYGLTDFGKVYTHRQTVVGLALCSAVRTACAQMMAEAEHRDRGVAVSSMLALAVDRHMNQNNTLTIFNAQGEKIEGAVNDKTLPMAWDFPEPNPLAGITGSIQNAVAWVVAVAAELSNTAPLSAKAMRGSATDPPPGLPLLDAVVTDPPYYDNVSYAVLSDFFYSWLKRSVGDVFPAHFAGAGAPKKQEAVMDSERHGGDPQAAKAAYQQMMQLAFLRLNERLKPGAPLCCVYAHKTTLGPAPEN